MRDAKLYRQYAEDCRRIARTMPADQQAKLLEIAEAWIVCAGGLEKQDRTDDAEAEDAVPPCMPRPWPESGPGHEFFLGLAPP